MKPFPVINAAILTISVILCTPAQLLAQMEDSAPGMAAVMNVNGYVILSNGDTLYGKIRWALKYVENNPVEIKFTAENGNSKVFNASEVRGFGNKLKAWEENIPVAYELPPEDYVVLPSFKKGVPVFMNRLIEGPVTVYQNRSATIISSSVTESKSRIDGIGFTWEPGEGLTIGPTYRTDYRVIESRTRFSSYYVSKGGANYIKVEKENYEETFKSLFGDCQSIDEELAKNPDLNKFKNFMLMVEIYNQVCGSR